MFRILAILALLAIQGRRVNAREAEVFSFDVSPLSIKECSGRPPNNCGPQRIRESDCLFLDPRDGSGMHKLLQEFDKAVNSSFGIDSASEAQTYITLHCDFGHSENTTKEDLTAQVRVIRKRSPKRAIQLGFRSDALLDPEIFAPVSHQIVLFTLSSCTDTAVTSRLPSLNFTNLLSFSLDDCDVKVTIRKADFSSLQRIRKIRFYDMQFVTIEPGTFTDLPDLTMFWMTYHGYQDKFKDALERLRCDAQFDWLWDWLEQHPDLLRHRQIGEVYRIGSLESSEETEMLTRKCTKPRNSTNTDETWLVQLQLT